MIKMINKKSQITWFIVIGIVILFIAGGIFFYATTILKNIPEPETRGVEPVNAFIIGCVDQTATRAIELAGKQGGYIFESQGGLVKDFKEAYEGKFFINYEDYKVAYGIKKRQRDYGMYRSEPPDYPWVGFPAPDHDYKGLFGDSELPLLYKKDGPFSIQAEIESYVNNNLPECLDFSVFVDYGITTTGSVKTEVKIAKNDVVVTVDYPVQVKLGLETTNLNDFTVRKSIRLKQVYEFTKNLITLDNTDISFSIERSSGGIYSDRKEDIYEYDDIIIIKDQKSLLGNSPYEFWFASQNRPPAFNPEDGDHQDPDEDSLKSPTEGAVSDGQYTDHEPTFNP